MVRDGLRRLGVKERIGYIADIYQYCNIDEESFGISPYRYTS